MKKFKITKVLFIAIIGTLLPLQTIAQTVYITKTGTKYHTSTCRYLQSSKISISLSDAKAKGYTACGVCKPSGAVSPTTQGKDTTVVKNATTTNQTAKPATSTTTSKQCSAITQAGTRCKRTTKSPNGKCWQHGGN